MSQDSFTVGGEKLKYPGDPAGSAWNVINCRCTTIPVIEDEVGVGEQSELTIDQLKPGDNLSVAEGVLRSHTQGTGREAAAIFDANGRLLSEIVEGSESSALALSRPEYGRNLTHVHTHPRTASGRGFSVPSRSDVNTIYQDTSLEEMRIFTADGGTWRLGRLDTGTLSGHDVRQIYRGVLDDLALADNAPRLFSRDWYTEALRLVGEALDLRIDYTGGG